ncbi:hypothetical protein, partial [Paraburkholderia humisilvae]
VPEDKRPVAMRRSEGGTWQDPQTLAHYAQIGAKLYRVAKDEAASSGGYVVWNPTDAYGGGRERTIRLENRDGQWQRARNVPGLKGGAPEPARLPQLPADDVDIELANLDDRPRPQGPGADPAGMEALVNRAYAEQARGLPLSDAEQQIHDSLFAPGRQQPAAPHQGGDRAEALARLVPTLPEHIDALMPAPPVHGPGGSSSVAGTAARQRAMERMGARQRAANTSLTRLTSDRAANGPAAQQAQ